MFGFGRKRSKADATIAVMPQAIEAASEKWRFFCDQLVFTPEVLLVDRIASFSAPFFAGARQNIPALREAPDAVLLMIVAEGIERSGTHTRAEIEQALGTRFPD